MTRVVLANLVWAFATTGDVPSEIYQICTDGLYTKSTCAHTHNEIEPKMALGA